MLSSISWGVLCTGLGSLVIVVPYIHGLKLNKFVGHIGAMLMITGLVILFISSLN